MQALLDQLPGSAVTSQMLLDAGLSSYYVFSQLREELNLPSGFTMEQARMVLGIRYELSLRRASGYTDYTLVEDVDTAFISMVTDGNYAGAEISQSTVREYETTAAAHIWVW